MQHFKLASVKFLLLYLPPTLWALPHTLRTQLPNTRGGIANSPLAGHIVFFNPQPHSML